MIDLEGDDELVLDEEQAIVDNHEDKVAEIIERLQLVPPESKAAPWVAHPLVTRIIYTRGNHVEKGSYVQSRMRSKA